tara:strand:- start:450 stop:1400 length:951 start_codon:yes stop_codon:yes gene_type:complete
MTYVGATPTTGDFKKLDSITTSSATTFNLRQGSVAVYPQSANHCIVSLNGVIQAPLDAFTIVNDTIVFASSLASSDTINFILVLGNVNDIGVPSDDTISTAKIQTNAITNAKMADDAIGVAELSATGTASSSTYLRGDNSWASAGLTGWSTGGTNNSLIPSATDQGIYLGVSSATASNLLDDYEEGTWTAAVVVDSGAMTLESAFNTGSYVKIGNIVNVQGFFKVDSTSASAGYIGISGLPFAAGVVAEGGDYSSGSCFVRSASSAIGGGVINWMEGSGNSMTALRENGTTGVGNTLTSHFDSGTDFTLNLTYKTV